MAPHWLDPVATAAADGKPLLVVCRTSATVREVLRRLADGADRGEPKGFAGLQVTTLGGLVAGSEAGRLFPTETCDPEAALPPKHLWAKLLADRPGLRRMLAVRVRRAHELQAAGGSLAALSPELRALVDADWMKSDVVTAAERLLAAPRSPGRVIAIGFGRAPFSFLGGVSALDRQVLAWLAPDLALGDDDPFAVKLAAAIPALRLADVAAEARAAAREAGRTVTVAGAGRVVLLSPDGPTSERVAAAMRRNGVPVADDGSVPLTRHALVSAIRPLLPVFASRGGAPVDVADLARLLTDPVLSRSAPAGGVAPVPEFGDANPRASTRLVRDLLASCRRARAPLADWIASLKGLELDAVQDVAQADPEDRPSRARRLVSARVLVAQVSALADNARGGTLRDVERFLSAVKLSDPEGDRLGRAVLGALAREGFRPPTDHDLDDALAGSVASGRIARGVVILPYESYDGRDADLLLLAGVHDKGVARVPAPDPFLGDGDLAALSLPRPGEAVAERLAIALWAASRARRTFALVAGADASGRAVSPPVDLALAFDDRERADSYGRAMDVPERRDLAALAPSAGKPDRLTVQIDAEWVRRGAAFDPDHAVLVPPGGGETLADQLERDLPRMPPDLRPWLGEVGAHPRGDGSGLPRDFVLSASRLGKFTACLYHGFLDSVLRLRAQKEVAEELDPREVGSAIHAALERALAKATLLVPEAKLEGARAKLLQNLVRETENEAKKLAVAMPDDAEALRVASDGYVSRWVANWSRWLGERVRSVEDQAKAEGKVACAELPGSLLGAVAVALGGAGMAKTARKQLDGNVRAALVAACGDPGAIAKGRDRLVAKLSKANAATVGAALATPATRIAIEQLCAAAGPALATCSFDPDGDLEVKGTEVRFGDMPREDGTKGPPLHLPLGRAPIAVRGSIDLVLRRRGQSGPGALRVCDYKTGGLAGKSTDLLSTLLRPQLALYALVLEIAGEELLGDAGTVEQLMQDHVKVVKHLQAMVRDGELARAREALGRVFDRARDGSYPSLPHPSGCPALVDRGAYCDFPEVCRIRARYEAADVVEEEEA